ncbi:MAG: hypothetical protein KDA65_18625, partial [Planctomycetaceae bacterium]|nr:hypothetical protein [Planctomycetaceae bacterium]
GTVWSAEKSDVVADAKGELMVVTLIERRIGFDHAPEGRRSRRPRQHAQIILNVSDRAGRT